MGLAPNKKEQGPFDASSNSLTLSALFLFAPYSSSYTHTSQLLAPEYSLNLWE